MELINRIDKEIAFDSLEEAKKYYCPKEEPSKDDYIGDDFDEYIKDWKEYRSEIEQAENLEELANVLNSYTDIFSNGAEWYVK